MDPNHNVEGEGAPRPLAPPDKLNRRGHWAEYLLCPVCHGILSGKKKKLVELPDGMFVHLVCHEVLKRRVKEQAAKAAALKAEAKALEKEVTGEPTV